jgi:hypothetical protein
LNSHLYLENRDLKGIPRRAEGCSLHCRGRLMRVLGARNFTGDIHFQLTKFFHSAEREVEVSEHTRTPPPGRTSIAFISILPEQQQQQRENDLAGAECGNAIGRCTSSRLSRASALCNRRAPPAPTRHHLSAPAGLFMC